MKWFIQVVKKYAVFSGRAGRAEYWFYILFYIIFGIVLGVIERTLGLTYERTNMEGQAVQYGILTGIYSLALLLPSLGVSIRRLHDTGKTGWWLLIGLIPLLGWIVLIIFYVQEGNHGENEYGPEPAVE